MFIFGVEISLGAQLTWNSCALQSLCDKYIHWAPYTRHFYILHCTLECTLRQNIRNHHSILTWLSWKWRRNAWTICKLWYMCFEYLCCIVQFLCLIVVFAIRQWYICAVWFVYYQFCFISWNYNCFCYAIEINLKIISSNSLNTRYKLTSYIFHTQ